VTQQASTKRDIALFSYGFRPFFLLGAAWAALAVPLWIATYSLGPTALPFEAGFAWHIHEMIFGYGSAIIAGFLLTAVPNWTGRSPVSGLALGLLVFIWLSGRAAMLLGSAWPHFMSILDAAFLIILAGVIWREVLASRNTRNYKVAGGVTAFALANIGFHTHQIILGGLAPIAIDAGLAVLLFMIFLIGGRITPTFTRNWLAKRSIAGPAAATWFDAVTLVVTVSALAAWVFWGASAGTGAALVLAGLLNCLRLSRWRGLAAFPEPLLFVLHVGYAWATAALLLIGLSSLFPIIVPRLAGVHAAGAGAVGVMSLAVMARVSLGHTGRDLHAGPATVAIFALVNSAALVRVVSAFLDGLWQVQLNPVAAALWMAAFVGFCLTYGRLLMTPRQSKPA